jgi:hypothetical protein
MAELRPSQTRQINAPTLVSEHIGQVLHDMEQEQAGLNLRDLSFPKKAELCDVSKSVVGYMLLWNASCREASETN